MKKTLLILGALTGVTVLLAVFVYFKFQPDVDYVLNFIKNNPNKSSFVLIRNGEELAALNKNKIMPLASTVKIIKRKWLIFLTI
ncbi:MAG: hypothetical protein AAFZ15_21225 [Bacteroidota bacterium]